MIPLTGRCGASIASKRITKRRQDMATMDRILCCSCFGQEKKAIAAFAVAFPDRINPEIIKGKDKIFKFAQEVDNKHIEAISKLSGRFAYYVELDGNNIIMEYDLVQNRRLR
jgi:hypothetical protein